MRNFLKKFGGLFLIALVGILMFSTTGCKKEDEVKKGTFIIDNYVEYSVNVNWRGYNMFCPAFGYTENEVEVGSGNAEVYANGYGYWGSIYITIPENGYDGVIVYWGKMKDGTQQPMMQLTSKGKPVGLEKPIK
jgi:hypothetical protein